VGVGNGFGWEKWFLVSGCWFLVGGGKGLESERWLTVPDCWFLVGRGKGIGLKNEIAGFCFIVLDGSG